MTRWLVVLMVLSSTYASAETREVSSQSRLYSADSALSKALRTDAAWVRRLNGPDTALARFGPELVPRLQAIFQRAHRENLAQGDIAVCKPCPDQLSILITLGDRSSVAKHLDIYVWFREAQARLVSPAWWEYQVSLKDDAPALLAMVKRTLPRDSVVQRYVWRPRPDSLPRADAPEDETKPKFGEHVYVDELPEAIVKVPPEYPAEARKLGVDGTVMVQALVNRSGDVADTRVIKSIPPLDDAAVAAVRQWKFKPATSKGEPVAVWVAIPIKFTLH